MPELDPERHDPPKKVLIDAVLDGLKQGVVFLVDDKIDSSDVERLAQKTERLALAALVEQFGTEAASKFFAKSDNPWILRTSFGGWVFFYPIEVLTPEMSMAGVGAPDFVYWPDAKGNYERVPWIQWSAVRGRGNVWRPTSDARAAGGPRSVWERLRDP